MLPVVVRHPDLVIRVLAVPHALDHGAGALTQDIRVQHFIRILYRHIWDVLHRILQKLQPLLHCKAIMLFEVDHGRHNDPVKQCGCPPDQVHVSEGDRVKASRNDSGFHTVSSLVTVVTIVWP